MFWENVEGKVMLFKQVNYECKVIYPVKKHSRENFRIRSICNNGEFDNIILLRNDIPLCSQKRRKKKQ